MTVKRTRELLGQKVAHITDEELGAFIETTSKSLDVLMMLAAKKASLQRNSA